MVNLPTAGVDPHVAFGGRKGSSFGPREQGADARDFFTQTKTVFVRLDCALWLVEIGHTGRSRAARRRRSRRTAASNRNLYSGFCQSLATSSWILSSRCRTVVLCTRMREWRPAGGSDPIRSSRQEYRKALCHVARPTPAPARGSRRQTARRRSRISRGERVIGHECVRWHRDAVDSERAQQAEVGDRSVNGGAHARKLRYARAHHSRQARRIQTLCHRSAHLLRLGERLRCRPHDDQMMILHGDDPALGDHLRRRGDGRSGLAATNVQHRARGQRTVAHGKR